MALEDDPILKEFIRLGARGEAERRRIELQRQQDRAVGLSPKQLWVENQRKVAEDIRAKHRLVCARGGAKYIAEEKLKSDPVYRGFAELGNKGEVHRRWKELKRQQRRREKIADNKHERDDLPADEKNLRSEFDVLIAQLQDEHEKLLEREDCVARFRLDLWRKFVEKKRREKAERDIARLKRAADRARAKDWRHAADKVSLENACKIKNDAAREKVLQEIRKKRLELDCDRISYLVKRAIERGEIIERGEGRRGFTRQDRKDAERKKREIARRKLERFDWKQLLQDCEEPRPAPEDPPKMSPWERVVAVSLHRTERSPCVALPGYVVDNIYSHDPLFDGDGYWSTLPSLKRYWWEIHKTTNKEKAKKCQSRKSFTFE